MASAPSILVKISIRKGWSWPIVLASLISKRLAFWCIDHAVKVEVVQ